VFALFAGAITTVVLDRMEAKLATIATGPVSRAVDSESVAKFETSVRLPGADRQIPVAVTVYKKHKRVRIQVLTHELTRAEAEAVENLVAEALELRIVDRSDAHDEEKVRAAFVDTTEPDEEDGQAAAPVPPARDRPPRPR
jgi:septal ring factor EnvC (AmiA/AmiB activator)